MTADIRNIIETGRTAIGIELGSTRIKAVLTGPDHTALAVGSHDWENQFVDRVWTYSLEAVWEGLRACFAALADDVRRQHGAELRTTGALGVSAMMHGYLAFDADGELLTPFRTWRNTNTGDASEALSELFGYNIPHRWSIAHLYQAVLNGEEHLSRLAHLTTLAGYVHWKLTGRQVLGVGDASGVFPIDIATGGYDARRIEQFDELAAGRLPRKLAELLPAVLPAGEPAGTLTEEGARLLDPSGTLQPGAALCPPEGDAGTGMVATNSVARRTGNISAGTSIFAMIVLDGELSRVHPEVDLVTTPAGDLVAMVHCNNGASELNAWAGLFAEFTAALGVDVGSDKIFETLFRSALAGAPDGGGLLAFNNLSGEPITKLHEGRPLFLRVPGSSLSLATFMRTQIYAALATLRIGMDVLQKAENVQLDRMFAHGGLFKTPGVAQNLLAAAIDTPVSVGDLAAEGGAWGIAVLAGFLRDRAEGQTLDDFLNTVVFADARLETVSPDPADVEGFTAFMERYAAALPIQQAAVDHS
ncbi:xylulokinase [Actinoplanes sp. OR16]|uniref:xylulokinase n=1 Tax=Actinoplanes sp. OR16 TaxID=946334 RepID=UPI000FD8B8CE|nr:FGGY-family carbohydrate kinase [Actinoplanes sp. OR16]